MLALANVGDSRAYVFSGGAITQVTDDHSLAEERMRHGEMTEEEAAVHPQRHILTRALGVADDVEADMWELELQTGDRLLLCSDGLTNEVGSDETGRHPRRGRRPRGGGTATGRRRQPARRRRQHHGRRRRRAGGGGRRWRGQGHAPRAGCRGGLRLGSAGHGCGGGGGAATRRGPLAPDIEPDPGGPSPDSDPRRSSPP